MEQTVIERAARAAFPGAWEDGRYMPFERSEQLAAQTAAIAHTRAVLLAIREPGRLCLEAGMSAAEDALDSDYSSDMDGGRHEYSYLRSDAPSAIWQAMIDKLLADPA